MKGDPVFHLSRMKLKQEVWMEQVVVGELQGHKWVSMMNSQLTQQFRQQRIEHLKGGKDHVFDPYKHSKPEKQAIVIAKATSVLAVSLKLGDEQSRFCNSDFKNWNSASDKDKREDLRLRNLTSHAL